ncbi:MAG: hypothetical protein AMJ90_09980 [candidate division Zixibacteria bacterium SM23_73_2]|nr:MAG: hypothetical protein AMJ90_09980 [candidate division Zixibacteria bacterium SM23_73_2]
MHPSPDIGIWIGGLLTLGIFSFLYGDNPYYKFCEALFVGVSAGHWFITLFWTVFIPKLLGNIGIAIHTFRTEGFAAGMSDYMHWSYIFGGILGFLMILRLFPKIGWISRWSLAFVVGTTAGYYFINYLVSNGLMQIQKTILPLTSVGNIILVVGTFCGLIYFFFSKEHKGAFGGLARVGIWFLMITFGASFGYTVMSRMSLLIGRMDYIFGIWLGMIR